MSVRTVGLTTAVVETRQTRRWADSPSIKHPSAASDGVARLSAAARAIDEDAISAAVWQGEPRPVPAQDGGLPPIPSWMGSYGETLKRSEAGLKLALQQLGIPIKTSFLINSNTSDGRIKVIGEFPGSGALENLINGNMDLHNALAASSGNAFLSRTVAVAQQGIAATRADPAHADAYNAWIVDMSRQIQSAQVLFQFAGGRLVSHMAGPDGAVTRELNAVPHPKG